MALHGGPARHSLSGLNWRTMTVADLDAVTAIAAIGFPDHFEGRDCFANRLGLNPSGCFVLAGEGKHFSAGADLQPPPPRPI